MRCPLLTELPPPRMGKTGWPWTEDSRSRTEYLLKGDASSWPLISIVTPSYNQAGFIEETIRSVLLQGYPHLEYMILDGGSTDGSLEIIRQYEPWLSYLCSRPDGGQSAALAEGFRRARGDILAWLNSDDRYRPGTLARVASFFQKHSKVIFGTGDANFIDAAGALGPRMYSIRPNWFLTANLGVHCWPQPSSFWRRQAYEQIGGIDGSLRFCMDLDLFIRLNRFGPGIRIPGPPLADFRIHGQAKSTLMLDVEEKERLGLIRKYGKSYSKQWLLRLLWWLWYKPTSVRLRLHRALGWEW